MEIFHNCLTYRYRPKFYNLLPVFFEKSANYRYEPKILLLIAGVFLVVIFLFPCDISLSHLLSDDGLTFFCFSFCGSLGLFLYLKSKKHKGSDSLPSLMGNCLKFYLHVYLCQNFWVNGQKFGLDRGFIKDDVFNRRFINIGSLSLQPVDWRISKTLKLYRYNPRSSPFVESLSLLC